MIELFHRGTLLAKYDEGTTLELVLEDGRILHMGSRGKAYFKEFVTEADGLKWKVTP